MKTNDKLIKVQLTLRVKEPITDKASLRQLINKLIRMHVGGRDTFGRGNVYEVLGLQLPPPPEKVVCGWSMADINSVLQNVLHVPVSLLSRETKDAILDQIQDDADMSVGVNWDQVEAIVRENCGDAVKEYRQRRRLARTTKKGKRS